MRLTLREMLAGVRPWIIAEIGVNHNGRLEEALALVQMAARAGAHAVKFQAFRAERLVRPDAPLADYQARNMGHEGGQFDMLRALEIDLPALAACAAEARVAGLAFGVTPFDPDSLHEILALEPDFVKIGSGDADNWQLLSSARDCGTPVIVSTGMCHEQEVWRIVEWFDRARDRLALLHCVSAYPAPEEECNLLTLHQLRRMGVVTGFSDHTEGNRAAQVACALGAEILERHITLDRAAMGPDHACSCDEEDLRHWIAELEAVQRVLGDGLKRPMPSEENVRRVARKSLSLRHPLAAGDVLTLDHLCCLRPADGLAAHLLPHLLGRRLSRDVPVERPLRQEDLEGGVPQ